MFWYFGLEELILMRRDGVLNFNFKYRKGHINDIRRNAECGAVTPVDMPFCVFRGFL